jgi:ribosomal protein S18 acetylase RimI-like enzyme
MDLRSVAGRTPELIRSEDSSLHESASDLIRVRWASKKDLASLCNIDERVIKHSRRKFINSSISKRECLVALQDGIPAGFAIYNTGSFFDQTFLWALVTDPKFRRMGIGSNLIRRVESLCPNNKLFTSTNRSNSAMQALMKKLGYRRTGIVRNLDPGDSEIFYVKKLIRV